MFFFSQYKSISHSIAQCRFSKPVEITKSEKNKTIASEVVAKTTQVYYLKELQAAKDCLMEESLN